MAAMLVKLRALTICQADRTGQFIKIMPLFVRTGRPDCLICKYCAIICQNWPTGLLNLYILCRSVCQNWPIELFNL